MDNKNALLHLWAQLYMNMSKIKVNLYERLTIYKRKEERASCANGQYIQTEVFMVTSETVVSGTPGSDKSIFHSTAQP